MQRYIKGFRLFLRAVGVSTILTVLAVTAWADEPWRVTEVSGSARLEQGDGNWTPVAVGAVVAPGAMVETGADGRVVLFNEKDKATMSPNSRMQAPMPDEAKESNIIQKVGTLLFKIERAPSRRFAVGTPYLAAVVKGTTFTVTVRGDAGLVHVIEGAVLVASFGSQESSLVTPGQTAQVLAAGGRLQVIQRGEAVPAAPPAGKASNEAAKGKKGEKQIDPSDRKMIEKGHATLEDAKALKAESKADADNGKPINSVRSNRARQVANLDGSNGVGGDDGQVVVISTAIGAQSIDVAQATAGFIAGLPANNGDGNASKNVASKGKSLIAAAATGESGNGNSNAGGNGNGNSPSAAPAPAAPIATVAAPVVEAAAPAISTTGLMPLGGALSTPTVSAPTVTGNNGNGNGGASSNAGGNGNGNGNAGGNGNAPVAAAAPAPAAAAPTASAPVASAPVATAPAAAPVTVPVSAPTVSAPAVSAPVVSAPAVTAPVVTTPVVTTPVVTIPVVTAANAGHNGLAKGLNK